MPEVHNLPESMQRPCTNIYSEKHFDLNFVFVSYVSALPLVEGLSLQTSWQKLKAGHKFTELNL